MPQQAARATKPNSSKVVPFQVRQRPEAASDTCWSDIAVHITNIGLVLDKIIDAHGSELDETTMLAIGHVCDLCDKMRRVQQFQRRGYSADADVGLKNMATVSLPALMRRASWPGVPKIWLESIGLSGTKIGELVALRQASRR